MQDIEIVSSLGVILTLSALFIYLLQRFNIPNLVTYIITGLALFPILGIVDAFFQPQVPSTELVSLDVVKVIAKAGIALLLFLVGLELSLEKIKDVGPVAVVAGIGQVVFTAIGGFALAFLLGFYVMESLFIAVALTFSSTVVVVKLLDQKKHLDSLYGRIAVGIFLVQDLVVIVVLTLLAGLEPGESASESAVWLDVLRAFLGMTAILTLSLLASRYLLPRPFAWASRSPEMLFLWSLSWCFILVLLAEYFALSLEIGAFLAGLSLAQLPCSHDLRRRVHPLVNFFIAIFFVSLGAQMELDAAKEHLLSGAILSLFVLIGNPLIFIFIIARMGYTKKTAFLAGVTVAQISEFSFIFAAVGLRAELIDQSILSLVALVGLITIAASSYMILYNEELYHFFDRYKLLNIFTTKESSTNEREEDLRRSEHVIVIGMNTMGRALAKSFAAHGESVLSIDRDPEKLRDLPGETILGDIEYLSVLEEAHYDSAKLVVSALHIADTNTLLAFRCSQKGVPIVVHAFDNSVLQDVEDLPVLYYIDSKGSTVRAFEEIARRDRKPLPHEEVR